VKCKLITNVLINAIRYDQIFTTHFIVRVHYLYVEREMIRFDVSVLESRFNVARYLARLLIRSIASGALIIFRARNPLVYVVIIKIER